MTILTQATEICPTSTQKWIANGALLVDVREADEVAQLAFDVPNIINIPLSQFEERFAEVPTDREVVLVCRSGGRSLKATYYLHNHGYDTAKVVNMKLGIERWVQKGFPVKGDSSIVSEGGSCCSTGGCC
jgi:rhodanese-related sulfurtransferase